MNAIVDATAGPLTGLDPPDGGPWPTVTTTDVEIDRLPEETTGMSRYVNTRGHAIDLPDGTLVAPGESVDLDDETAAALVAAGSVRAAPEDDAPTPTKKEAKS